MKKILLIGLACLIVLLLMLLLMAPANTALNLVSDKVSGLQFNGVKGSIWNNTIDSVQYRQYKLNNISTKTSFLNLFAGQLQSQFELGDTDIMSSGEISLANQYVRVEDFKYQLQASWLDKFLDDKNLHLAGNIKGSIEQFELDEFQVVALNGQGAWQAAVLSYPNYQLELGDFKFKLLSRDPKEIRVSIVDNQGVLDLKGDITLQTDKSYRLEVNTTNQLPANLQRWIKAFGKEQNGRFYIQWNGRLP